MARGKEDVAQLFPAVVKNVAVKNLEVSKRGYLQYQLAHRMHFQLRKLVFVYLVRYAEEQQDLALLSISTFQRALKVNFSTENTLLAHSLIFLGSKSTHTR